MKNEVLDDWIRKAEGDYRTAKRELSVGDEPNYDAVCIFSQQCAEKYLKAFLIASTGKFPRIHDLTKLLDKCIQADESFNFIKNECDLLTGLLRLRYPADFAELEDAKLAMKNLLVIRSHIREKLGLRKKHA